MLEHFGEEGTILEGFYPQAQEVLNGITRQYPQQVWELVTKYLRPQIDSRAFHIKEWLRGGKFFREEEGALTLIPLEAVWIKPIMVVVRLTMETKIPPLILFFLIGIAVIVLAAK